MYNNLPENIKNELRTGWLEDQLQAQGDDDLIRSYSILVDEQVEEGELSRKDGKAKMKAFKKALKKTQRRAA